ncbi:DUF3267 domain-containing protein [Psychrobacillus sp. FJAT-51614]|uniref:DUF3267 domain-containing protein n=1 Tax=Psychrobacillus mangrovi TaxID=3117745 RepID=A0ABU8F7M7_9BACI
MENKEDILTIINIDLKKVAWSSLFITVFLSILGLFIYSWLYDGFNINFSIIDLLVFFLGYAFLIILHECFHLIGFWFFGKAPWSSMDYGVNLKMGIAYATSNLSLTNSAMKKALLLPFWMTGVLPMILGYSLESPGLVLLGAWLIAGAAGDFAMYKELIKYPSNMLIKDDPVEPKLYVLNKKRQDSI